MPTLPDTTALLEYLTPRLPGIKAIHALTPFTDGYSNLTYALSSNIGRLVLRMPPPGPRHGNAHDVVREFHLLAALHSASVAEAAAGKPADTLAPKPLLVCEDEGVLGAPYYLMSHVEGPIIRMRGGARKAAPPSPSQMATASHTLIDTLARLHRVALDGQLANLGRPEGYTQRQVDGWTARFAKAHTPDVERGEHIADYLNTQHPTPSPNGESASLIHNDYKFDNVVFADDSYREVRAILDWEMATVGHPLMDLGLTLAYWAHDDEVAVMPFLGMNATHLPGCPRRPELVARYFESRGLAPVDILYYYVFGNFKIAGIVQQLYARYVAGHSSDARFAQLGHVVNYLLRRATRALESGSIG